MLCRRNLIQNLFSQEIVSLKKKIKILQPISVKEHIRRLRYSVCSAQSITWMLRTLSATSMLRAHCTRTVGWVLLIDAIRHGHSSTETPSSWLEKKKKYIYPFFFRRVAAVTLVSKGNIEFLGVRCCLFSRQHVSIWEWGGTWYQTRHCSYTRSLSYPRPMLEALPLIWGENLF